MSAFTCLLQIIGVQIYVREIVRGNSHEGRSVVVLSVPLNSIDSEARTISSECSGAHRSRLDGHTRVFSQVGSDLIIWDLDRNLSESESRVTDWHPIKGYVLLTEGSPWNIKRKVISNRGLDKPGSPLCQPPMG